MTSRTPVDRHRTLRLLGALAGLSVALGACTFTGTEVVTASVPDDYRMRHPIAIEEANRSIVIFVGQGRGGLSAPQRADVIGLAQTWVHEGTGAIVVDVPVDTPNARTAAATFREVKAVLAAGGVPPRGVTLRHYHPDDPRTLATIRLSYPRIAAVAGPRVPALMRLLERERRVVQVGEQRFLTPTAWGEALRVLREGTREVRSYAAGEIREIFGVSRKFSIPLMEGCDRAGVSTRVGDGRLFHWDRPNAAIAAFLDSSSGEP